MTLKVLFVCLGNICRSPMAEAVFQKMVDEAGLSSQVQVDSAGTGSWHVDERPHYGTRQVLIKHGITYNGRARQITQKDMTASDTYIIAMDQGNVTDLQLRFGQHPNLYRLLDFAQKTDERNVPDPYYTGKFDEVYQLVKDGCRGLLATIQEQEKL
jgi:protein-tyrosine phosphatase